ncbi:MAG TPA: glycerol-3-phosphate 1-O-acyltransferase PlsY [Gemmatimonadaceae bacterium]|nr:glycerol-3-phosphate 1-O-acyltransferase PlsY [Gemmatimonadaceae bacterium]
MHPAWGLPIAYVAGSIPAAYIAGRLVKGIDLRQHGSGNLGATNVYRLLGAKVAAAVLLFDAAKGALPVLFLPRLLPNDHPLFWAIAYGVAAIAGHVRSLFLLWKGGGKGVATAAGVFGALVPLAALTATLAWGLVLWLSGYVSLASLTAALVLAVVVGIRYGPASPLFGVSVAVGAFVFWTHRANIGRLRRGEEHRFGRRARGSDGTATTPGASGQAQER